MSLKHKSNKVQRHFKILLFCVIVGKRERQRPPGRPSCRRQENKLDPKNRLEGRRPDDLAQKRDNKQALFPTVIQLLVP